MRAVTRDRIGFLGVATDNGLARYDGRSFMAYQAALESRYVKDLVRRPDGPLLLANDAGVFVVTPRTDTATVRRLIDAHPRPTDSTVVYPNGVHWGSEGRLWICQSNGAVTPAGSTLPTAAAASSTCSATIGATSGSARPLPTRP